MVEYVKSSWGRWSGDFNSFMEHCKKELNKAFDSLANDIGNQDDGLRENSDLDDAFGITAAYKDKQKKFMIDLFGDIVPYQEPVRF